MPDKDLSFCAGHRERLRQKFEEGHITDYEFMEMLLTFAIPRRDVRPLSRALMSRYKTIPRILAAPEAELKNFRGIGRNATTFLKALYKLSMMQYTAALSTQPIFHDSRTLGNYCRMLLSNKNHEEFHVLYLDGMRRLIDSYCHSVGTLDSSIVTIRAIVARAAAVGAHSVILLHNHPKCTAHFSEDDVKLTQQLVDALSSIDVVVYDHLLVTGQVVLAANQKGFAANKPITLHTADKFFSSMAFKVLAEIE